MSHTPPRARQRRRLLRLRLVIAGNKAWAAAWEVRKRWVAQLLWRRTAPKQVTRFVAEQLLTMPDALRRRLPNAAGRLVFTELTGKPLEAVLRDCETYPAARVPLLTLAPIAIAYESEMAGDGERRNTWRTDRWAPCSRKDAARWLQFLASLGYQLSAIEQAVADGMPYTGDDTPGEQDTRDDAAHEPAVNSGPVEDGADQAGDHTGTVGADETELPGGAGGACTDQAVA